MKKYVYYSDKSWLDTLANITIPKGRISFVSDKIDEGCLNPYVELDLTEEQINDIDNYIVNDKGVLERNTVVSDYIKEHSPKSVQQRVETLEQELHEIKTMQAELLRTLQRKE